MGAWANAGEKLADKLVELLEVFDLSFVISGAVGLVAIMIAFGADLDTFVGADAPMFLAGVVAAYFIGLACFAIGRRVRARLPGAVVPAEEIAGRAHALADVEELSDLFVDGRLDPAHRTMLYDRLWVHVRTLPELAASFSLLKRYWILAATFDGLAVAVLLWNAPIAVALKQGATVAWLVVSAITVLVSGFAFAQANEYRRYQAAELLATVRQWAALYSSARRLEREHRAAETAALLR